MTSSVVVTGMGVAAPNGLGLDAYWDATCSARSGIARISRFDPAPYPAQLAGEVPGFDARTFLPGALLAQTDHMTRLALVAADWALADSGADLRQLSAYDVGVVTAGYAGGVELQQRELEKMRSKGRPRPSAYLSFAWFYAVNTGQISIRNGLKGAGGVVIGEQAGGLDALAQGRRHIRRGGRMTVAGGVDGSLCPWGWACRLAGERLSAERDPDLAYLPFDRRARGHVPGEGGALHILEESEAARRRGARIYGEIAGYGSTFDPPPGSGRPPGLGRAIQLALADAGVEPDGIDVVFADAAGWPEPDRAEAEAINEVFGRYAVPVTAPKTMTGRLSSGAAPLDVAAALLALRDGVIPPTLNSSPDPDHGIDLVTRAPRSAPLRAALVLARGHPGFNSAMVVRAAR
ncbi:ketosynthase chain-length factor [Streptomyces sp. NPDC005017]|uniref:ketosynthase chain-length factor n=1 Tax=Streptomyces sp. NPDC005017 TaxID=3364706 RepID=UPI0036B20686